MPDLMLAVDGNNLTHRAYHGYMGGRRSSEQQHSKTFAVSGMLMSVARRARQVSATHLMFAFDPPGGCPTRRNIIESYKQGRKETPGDLVSQLEMSWRILRESGLHVERPDGWEADDVLASAARQYDLDILLLTSDRDAIQSVSATARIMSPADGALLGESEIIRKYGVPPRLYPHVAALRGEPGDGIPGVEGVGKQGATKLVQSLGEIEAVLAADDEQLMAAAGRRTLKAIRRDGEKAREALRAATLRTDLPISEPVPLARLDVDRIAETMGKAGLRNAAGSIIDLVHQARRRTL